MRVPSKFHKNTYEISGRNAIRRVLPMIDDQNTISEALTLTVSCLSRECMISSAKEMLNIERIERNRTNAIWLYGKRRNEQTKERLLVEQWSFKTTFASWRIIRNCQNIPNFVRSKEVAHLTYVSKTSYVLSSLFSLLN